MRSKITRLLGGLAAITLLSGLTVLSAPQPAEAAGPCGSGYSLVGHYPVKVLSSASATEKRKFGPTGTVVSYLDIYWNGAAKKNCAVANASGSTRGDSLRRSAFITVDRTKGYGYGDQDHGIYAYYAGPVYTHAQRSGDCVDASAGIWNQTSTSQSGRAFAWTEINNKHCG